MANGLLDQTASAQEYALSVVCVRWGWDAGLPLDCPEPKDRQLVHSQRRIRFE